MHLKCQFKKSTYDFELQALKPRYHSSLSLQLTCILRPPPVLHSHFVQHSLQNANERTRKEKY